MPCFIKPDMHHTWLCIMPCLCLCIYHVVCLFPVLLLSSGNVAIVRIRSTTPFVFFMDSFFFLTGSQARWPYPRNHFYLCLLVARSFCYAAIPTTCFIMPSTLPCQDSNPPCPSKPLFGYVTALLSPSYSVVSCRWRLKFVPCWNMEMLFLVGTCLLVGISQYLLFN